MRLTSALNGPPVFHFWKHFGAGKKRRIPYYKQWWNIWRNFIWKKKVADHTLSIQDLPPGSRLMEAEDFMQGPLDAMPEQLLKLKNEKVLYDHPWPFNVKLDPIKSQKPRHCYTINTRFFAPRDDCLALTNTVLESDQMKARPPIEPTEEHVATCKRQYDWATKNDSVLIRLPKKREWPKINLTPITKYGLPKERQEVNVMNSMYDFAQAIIAQHYHKEQNSDKLREIMLRRSVAFPNCNVPFKREDREMNLRLCIDSMSIGNSPLPLIETNPIKTKDKEPINIRPRSWKSLLEQSREYTPDWSFTLPRNAYLNTIQVGSRIKRDHRNRDEMLSRLMVHAFGLGSQYVRLKSYERRLECDEGESKQASVILQDPMFVAPIQSRDDDGLLEQPIVLQAIGFDLMVGDFHFMRYQLNSLNFDDTNPARVKNQAWYSGPVVELAEAIRYYLDFQAFDSKLAAALMAPGESSSVENSMDINQQRLVNN